MSTTYQWFVENNFGSQWNEIQNDDFEVYMGIIRFCLLMVDLTLFFLYIWPKIHWKPLFSVSILVLYISVALLDQKLWKFVLVEVALLREPKFRSVPICLQSFILLRDSFEFRSAPIFIHTLTLLFDFNLLEFTKYWGEELDIYQFWAEV